MELVIVGIICFLAGGCVMMCFQNEGNTNTSGYELFRVQQGSWVVHDAWGNRNSKYITYRILFNKDKNHYKLTMDGYRPHEHELYSVMQNEVIRLNSAIKNI